MRSSQPVESDVKGRVFGLESPHRLLLSQTNTNPPHTGAPSPVRIRNSPPAGLETFVLPEFSIIHYKTISSEQDHRFSVNSECTVYQSEWSWQDMAVSVVL